MQQDFLFFFSFRPPLVWAEFDDFKLVQGKRLSYQLINWYIIFKVMDDSHGHGP